MKTKGKPRAAKPSPLPWKQDDGLISDENGVEVVDLYDYPAAYLNAALIVRAVNAHAGLVALVRRLDEVSECFDLREDKGRIALAQEINALGHEARAALKLAQEAR